MKIYAGQVGVGSPGIYHNYPGISCLLLIANDNETWVLNVKNFCIVFTICILGCVVAWSLYKKIPTTKSDFYI